MKAKIASLIAGLLMLGLTALGQQHRAQPNPNPNPNPNPAEVRDENATERRSGIADSVDITDGPRLEAVSRDHAVLAWTTNKTAATRVVYGTDPDHMTQHAYHPGGSLNHRVELTGLRPGATYYYAVENRGGRQRYDGQFRTPR